MKYKVNDIVKVKLRLKVGKMYGLDSFVPAMIPMLGRKLKIIAIYDSRYFFGNSLFGWTDEMIEKRIG